MLKVYEAEVIHSTDSNLEFRAVGRVHGVNRAEAKGLVGHYVLSAGDG